MRTLKVLIIHLLVTKMSEPDFGAALTFSQHLASKKQRCCWKLHFFQYSLVLLKVEMKRASVFSMWSPLKILTAKVIRAHQRLAIEMELVTQLKVRVSKNSFKLPTEDWKVAFTECTEKGGTAAGSCASGFGTCCLFAYSQCGMEVSQNNTYVRYVRFKVDKYISV